MGVRKRYQALVLLVLLTFAAGMFVGRQDAAFFGEAGADPSGHVSVKVERDGVVIYKYEVHNLITTIGSTHIRDFLGWANQTNAACINIALSNDAAPQDTWTKLPAEITGSGLVRAAGTPSSVNVTAYQTTYTWTASAAADVQCTGLHWSGVSDSDNNLFAAASISSVSLQNNDQLQVTWTVNIPDG